VCVVVCVLHTFDVNTVSHSSAKNPRSEVQESVSAKLKVMCDDASATENARKYAAGIFSVSVPAPFMCLYFSTCFSNQSLLIPFTHTNFSLAQGP